MHERPDLKALQDEFAKVDIFNNDALRQWFLDHRHLTVSDCALVVNRSCVTIRRWRRRLNISNSRPPSKFVPKAVVKPILIDVPADWTQKEWLEQQLAKHSVKALSKAIGVDGGQIYKYAKQYNIKTKTYAEATKSTHPCCNHQWCWHHYIELGLSQLACAKLAGVSRATFAIWLNSLRISTRTTSETIHKTPTIYWVRDLIRNLRKQATVRRVYLNRDNVHVRFRAYTYETYYFLPKKRLPLFGHRVDANNSRIVNVPKVNFEYEVGLDGENEYPAHLVVNASDWNRATFIEQRLMLHEFIRRHTQRDWIQPKFPPHILQQDKNNLYNTEESSSPDGTFEIKCTHGRKLMLHFFDFRPVAANLFKSPRRLAILARYLIKYNIKLSTYNLFVAATKTRPCTIPYFNFCDPFTYSAIFKRLNVKGLVLDLMPGCGARAIACAMARLPYSTPEIAAINHAADNGFIDFFNLQYEPYMTQSAEIVIADADYKLPDVEAAFSYSRNAKRLLLFVPGKCRSEIQGRYKPEAIIKLKRYLRPSDYMFIY